MSAVRRARYAGTLLAELVRYSWVNRAWWVAMLMVMLAATVALLSVGHAAAPYTLYTLF